MFVKKELYNPVIYSKEKHVLKMVIINTESSKQINWQNVKVYQSFEEKWFSLRRMNPVSNKFKI